MYFTILLLFLLPRCTCVKILFENPFSYFLDPYTSSNAADWVAVLGDHHLKLRDDRFEQRRKVVNITIHENYKSMWFEGIYDTPPMNDVGEFRGYSNNSPAPPPQQVNLLQLGMFRQLPQIRIFDSELSSQAPTVLWWPSNLKGLFEKLVKWKNYGSGSFVFHFGQKPLITFPWVAIGNNLGSDEGLTLEM